MNNFGEINGQKILSISGLLAFTEKGNTFNLLHYHIQNIKNVNKNYMEEKYQDEIQKEKKILSKKFSIYKKIEINKQDKEVYNIKEGLKEIKNKPVKKIIKINKKNEIKDEDEDFIKNMNFSGIDKIID